MEIKRLKKKLAQLERKHAKAKGAIPRARIERSINATEVRKAMLEKNGGQNGSNCREPQEKAETQECHVDAVLPEVRSPGLDNPENHGVPRLRKSCEAEWVRSRLGEPVPEMLSHRTRYETPETYNKKGCTLNKEKIMCK